MKTIPIVHGFFSGLLPGISPKNLQMGSASLKVHDDIDEVCKYYLIFSIFRQTYA